MEMIEFQLAAHRKILIALLTVVAKDGECWERLMAHLRDDLVVQDHEEDPGIVPSADFAAQNAISEELMRIVTRAELRADEDIGGTGREPSGGR